jgi:RNA polymerase sigma factor (sigma-70 family)
LSAKELRRKVSDYRKAKQELVTANLGLVHAVVNQQWAVYSKLGIAKEELVQEGSLGLLRAAELFDPERGLRFSTYATIWTKASLSNSHMTELVHLPAREKTKWNKIVRAHKDLQEAGETATVHELAAVTGMAVEEVLATQRKMSQAQRVLSLDYEYNTLSRSGTESVAVNTMQNDKAFQQDADLAERTQMHADVVAAMTRNLDAREARLMRLRYGLSDGHMRSLAECADAMGLSQTRVQQLSQQCLKKLREAVEAESLEEYLLTIA